MESPRLVVFKKGWYCYSNRYDQRSLDMTVNIQISFCKLSDDLHIGGAADREEGGLQDNPLA